MSLHRLMLRALACVAIQAQADDAVPPTMAEDRVFDSRLDPIKFRTFDATMPGCIVYTDDDESAILNRGSGDGPMRRYVNLRVELVVGSFDVATNDFVVPTTSPELEAQLDLFEQQVRWALLALPNRVYSNAFREFVVRLEKISSHASRDEEGNNKFASRILHLLCEINDDCPPYMLGIEQGQTPIKIPFCDALGEFPAPWLRPMLQAMCSTPSMQNVLNVLAGNNNPAVYVPLLRRIGINVDAIEPEADPNILAAEGKTQGPDGRIEVENILEITS